MFSLIRLDYIQHLYHREEQERHLGQGRYCPYLSSLHLQLYISISSTVCVFTVWNVKHMSCLLLLFNSSVEITLEDKTKMRIKPTLTLFKIKNSRELLIL